MNKKIQKGIQYAAGIAFLAVAVVAIAGKGQQVTNNTQQAQAAASTVAPTIGIKSAQGSGSGAGGCDVNITNEMLSTAESNSDPSPSTYAGSSAYDGSPYGDTDCAALWLSGTGPFTEDFRIGVRMQNPKKPGGWGPWGWTPWASDIANGAGGTGWSPLVGAIQNVGSDPGHAMYQVAVDTQPLPAAGDTVSITKVGVQEGDGNDYSAAPYYCDQSMNLGGFAEVYSDGVTNGGWSTAPNGKGAGLSFSGVGDVADCTRVYLGGATITGAQETANTVPTSFNASQTLTTGTGGGAISITMKNVGTVSWPGTFTSSDQDGTQSGTCNYVYGGGSVDNAPASGSADGSTCSVKTNISLSGLDLVHTTANFTVSPASIPVTWNGVTKTTTYHAAQQITETGTCTFVPYLGRGFCSVDGSNCSGSTCSVTRSSAPSWTVSYSGGGYAGNAIAPGGSYTFDIASMQAPSTANTYGETWQMESNGTPFGEAFTLPITVKGASNGIVNVQSVNSVTSGAVSASWNTPETKPTITDLCGTLCTGTSKTWNNLSTDANIIDVSPQDQSAGSLYALHGVENGSSFLAAKTPGGPLQQLFAFSRNLLFTPANAWNVCGAYGSTPCYSTSTYTPSLTLTSGSQEASFAIVWDPIAAITVSPSSWSPSATAGGSSATQAISVENSGAPGSVLSWTASSNKTWLTISPASGAGVDQGDGSAATVTANPSGLSAGTYTGTITFNGSSTPGFSAIPITKTFTVTFTVAANPSTPVTVSCSPSSVSTNGTATCTASGGDGSGYTWATDNGTISAGGTFTAPSSAGVAHITAAAKDDPGNVSAPFTITITLPKCDSSSCQATCNPNLTATPSSIVVPESSDLNYNCSNVTSCTLYQGATQLQSTVATGGVVSSTYSVNPSVTTQYTLVCVNANYSDDSVTSNVQVQVGGPGQCEQNPNGVGCPQAQ